LLENSWQDYVIPVLAGEISLADAVTDLINLANEKNGHDNTSVVMILCRVSPEDLVSVTSSSLTEEPKELAELAEAEELEEIEELEETAAESDLAPSTAALLDLDLSLDNFPASPITTPVEKRNRLQPLLLIVGLLCVLLGGTSLGLFMWWQVNPQGFTQRCRQLPVRMQTICPATNDQ
jgi:protein phosphatase